MKLEEYKKEVDKNINSLFEKASNEEKDLLNAMIKVINDLIQERINIIAYLKSQIKKCNEDIKEFEKSMEGVYTTSVNENTLDEAPFVYKPMEEIINCIDDTIE